MRLAANRLLPLLGAAAHRLLVGGCEDARRVLQGEQSKLSEGRPLRGIERADLDARLRHPCAAVGPSLISVVRRMSRGSWAGNGRARCMVWRLSHMTRSPTRHLCE